MIHVYYWKKKKQKYRKMSLQNKPIIESTVKIHSIIFIPLVVWLIDGPSNVTNRSSNVTIQYTSESMVLWEGNGNITITCNADCNSECNYSIYRDGSLVSSRKTIQITKNRRNSGEYSCSTNNPGLKTPVTSSNTVTIDIQCTFNIYMYYSYSLTHTYLALCQN
jgi:hypothetical protein